MLMMSSCFVATWCSHTDGGVGGAVCDHGVLTVFKVPEQDPAGSQRGGQHQFLFSHRKETLKSTRLEKGKPRKPKEGK